MSILSKVSSGVLDNSQIYVIYGIPKVGKSTFASNFPKPLFLDLEDGSERLSVERLTSKELPTLDDVLKVTKELIDNNTGYKTLVVDSISKLEGLIHKHLCEKDSVDSIEKYDGGFGKGYTKSKEIMRDYLSQLVKLKEKGIDVVLIGHAQIKSFTDPLLNQTYDRYLIDANEKLVKLVTSNADNIFFVKHNVNTTQDKRTKKTQAFSDGKCVMQTEWSVGAEAGNRLGLPAEIPLDYEFFLKAKASSKIKSPDELVKEIKTLLKEVDADTKATVEAKLLETNDPQRLLRIKKKVLEIVQSV